MSIVKPGPGPKDDKHKYDKYCPTPLNFDRGVRYNTNKATLILLVRCL